MTETGETTHVFRDEQASGVRAVLHDPEWPRSDRPDRESRGPSFERAQDGTWQTLRAWEAGAMSHTDVMLALGDHDEPSDPRRLSI
jgi:hypothetical protein